MNKGAEGERFLAAFSKLAAILNDDPTRLNAEWEDDDPVASLCDELCELVHGFEIVEERSSLAFTNNVSAASAKARRNYDDRWRAGVWKVANRRLLASIKFDLDDLIGPDDQYDDEGAAVETRKWDQLADEIDDWKYEAREEAKALSILFDVINDNEWDWAEAGLRAWDRLTAVAALDVEGALWRRRALPHVLVPEHVARRYGASRASLYRRLHEAGKAFVFGTPLAALALQRAVLEEVLRAHWGAEGEKLTDLVRTAQLPVLAWDARADRLRRLANKALHYDPQKQAPETTDRALIEFFLLLRLLIEHAPEKGARS